MLKKISLTLVVAAILLAPASVFAMHDDTMRHAHTEPEATQNAELYGKPEARTDATQRKQRCEARQKKIDGIIARIAQRGQKQIDLFTTIAERTQKFYESKGKTLGNYDALVAEVNAKKNAAQAAVDTLKDREPLDCSGDVHGIADGFKTQLRTEIDVLKEYRTAVKNLIVGVKSVQSALNEGEKQ